MWSWHGGVFDFEVKEEEYENASLSPFKRLAPEEKTKKQKRIDDILNFLDDNPDLEDNLKASLQKELAQLYYALSNYIKAGKYARESLKLYEKRGDVEEMYHLYNLLESIYWDADENEKALRAAAIRISLKKSSDVDKYSLKNVEEDMKEEKETPGKILVVDDEPDMKRLIEQESRIQIRSKEWEFVYAGNGLEALERMQSHPDISVILLDIRMPDMDGLTFLDKLNAMDKPTIKTIMVTAYGDMENIRESMNNGAFDFITKPIDFNDLEKTIRKALKQIKIIKEAREAQKELTAFQKELEIASRIQNAMLPRKFPPCLHANMKAAKEVGGDFYDYVSIDKNRIAFFIGDVAGKGLSAALYAAKCSTILKTLVEHVKHPDECLRKLNDRIIEERDEDSNLSVSLFYGLLDLRSGDIEYSQAGNIASPYIISKNGEVKQLKEIKGIPPGLFGNTDYDCGKDKLTKGDMVCIFTDGIMDAQNVRNESYGDEKNRIISVLKKAAEMSAKDMVEIFMKDVKTFIGDAQQIDDITILCLKYLEK
jgi:sigma-B regulation protein RsbU (phosphoserine phosphatase)